MQFLNRNFSCTKPLAKSPIKAKKLGGHLKYENSLNEKSLDWYKIIPIILSVLFGLLNVYQKYDYNLLKTDYNSLKTQRDSLKEKLSDKSNKMIVSKEKPLKDTLRTKNLNDLKTD